MNIGRINNSLKQMQINQNSIDLSPIRNLLADIKDPAFYLQSQQTWALSLSKDLIS